MTSKIVLLFPMILFLMGCGTPKVIYTNEAVPDLSIPDTEAVDPLLLAKAYTDCRIQATSARNLLLFPLSFIINALIEEESSCDPIIVRGTRQPIAEKFTTETKSCDSYESYSDRRDCRKAKMGL